MKNILIIVALFVGISTSYSQATLEGKITDSAKQVLVGATVVLKGQSKGTDADFKGNFTLKNISEGTYTVQFSYIGYQSIEKQVQFKNNETISLNIILSESTETLQEVEIVGRKATSYKNKITYATRMPIAVKEAPIAINTTTKELLRDLNIVTFGDALKTLPSIVTDGNYPGHYTIRGFQGNEELLLNGNKISTGGVTAGAPLIIPNIERIEALMGASSALYGNTSAGGTINMVTKKPLEISRNFLKFSTGSYQTNRIEGDFTGPLDDNKKILYRLNMAYDKSEGRIILARNNSLFISPSVTFKPNDKTNVNVEFTYSSFEGVLPGGVPLRERNLEKTPIDFSVIQLSDYNKNLRTTLAITLNHKFTDNLSLVASYLNSTQGGELSSHQFSSFLTDTKYNIDYLHSDVVSKSASYSTFLKGKFNINETIEFNPIIGFDLYDKFFDYAYHYSNGEADGVESFDIENPKHIERDVFNYNRGVVVGRGDQDYSNTSIGVYIMGHFKIGKRINAVFNTRFDRYKVYSSNADTDNAEKVFNVITPRFALSYKVTDDLTAFANYSQYFKPVDDPAYRPLAGNEDYLDNPLQSVTYEGGLKSSLFNKRLFTTVTAYYIPRKNVVTEVLSKQFFSKQTDEISKGLEFTANGRVLPNWDMSLSYSYNKIKTTRDSEDGIVLSGNEIKNVGKQNVSVPFFTANAFTKYRISNGTFKGVAFGLGGNYVSERRSGAVGYIYPSYVVANANVFYNIGKFQMGLMANNIGDKKYIVSGLQTAVIIGDPTNYMVTVGYKF